MTFEQGSDEGTVFESEMSDEQPLLQQLPQIGGKNVCGAKWCCNKRARQNH